ncbi:uncharacterized protein O3C94_012054 [Discoglossus pictus]
MRGLIWIDPCQHLPDDCDRSNAKVWSLGVLLNMCSERCLSCKPHLLWGVLLCQPNLLPLEIRGVQTTDSTYGIQRARTSRDMYSNMNPRPFGNHMYAGPSFR